MGMWRKNLPTRRSQCKGPEANKGEFMSKVYMGLVWKSGKRMVST